MKEIAVYIHIPFCRSKCNYCAFNSFYADVNAQKEYVKQLINEIKAFSKNNIMRADTVYFGGGTPSFLYQGGIKSIINVLKDNFYFEPNEISIECNPESLTQAKLDEYKESKINRISIGLQSASNELLKLAKRAHNFDDFIKALDNCQKFGFDNVNCDIMLGLPKQKIQDVQNTLNEIFNYDIIKHISMYGLKTEENTPWQNISVDEELSANMYDVAFLMLKDKGFNRYEISNFSKLGYESKHNIKYWKRQDYIGFGLGAHSLVNNIRYANSDNMVDYILGKKEVLVLDQRQIEEEYIMLSLRMDEGIDLNDYKKQFGFDFKEKYFKQLEKLSKLKVIEITPNNLKIVSSYMGVMNSIITEFFI